MMQVAVCRHKEQPVDNFAGTLSSHGISTTFFILVFFVLWGTVQILHGEDSIRYTADMTRLPVSTDIAAMGDVGVVLPRRATAAIWNPAAASLLRRYEFSMEGADLYQHLSQHGCFAGAVPLKHNLGAVLSYQPFYSGRIELYDTIPDASVFDGLTQHTSKGFMRNYQHLVNLSFAGYHPFQFPRFAGTELPIPIDVSLGVNLKAYAQTMTPDRMYIGMGYNADIGLLARIGIDYDIATNGTCREVTLGATVRDVLPTSVVWLNSGDKRWMYSPERYRESFSIAQYYGVAYSDRSGDLFANWTIALALRKEYEVTYHGGIEAEFWNVASFRAGFSGKTPTLGAGFRYRRLFLDYAFRFEEIAFSLVRLTIGVTLPVVASAAE